MDHQTDRGTSGPWLIVVNPLRPSCTHTPYAARGRCVKKINRLEFKGYLLDTRSNVSYPDAVLPPPLRSSTGIRGLAPPGQPRVPSPCCGGPAH